MIISFRYNSLLNIEEKSIMDSDQELSEVNENQSRENESIRVFLFVVSIVSGSTRSR